MTPRSAIPQSTDVLIVGAGPTGLALAISLQQAGIDHLLIDKLPQGLNTSRAGVIHAHTLEVLETLGVSRELVARGLKLVNFTIRDRDRALVQLRFDRLPSAHPYLLMLPQDETERVLAGRLVALGGSIHRNTTALGVEQDADGVRVCVESADGKQVVRSRYVVGGDGMHSMVRAAAGIEFEGVAYEDSFVLADVRMDWAFDRQEVSLIFSPDGLVVVAPLPNGTYRVVATVDNAPEHPALSDVQALIDARGPVSGGNRVKEVIWSSRFRIHHRVAKSYRNGRFLLMGDAAHVHSPAGGQGMNTGIVDAVVLGELLSGVIHGHRTDSDLGLYEELRRPAAIKVLGLSGMLTKMATARGGAKRFARNAFLSLVDRLPVKNRIQMNLAGLSRKMLAVVPPASGTAHERRTAFRAAAE